ncbi:DUF1538 domain-containing protein [Beggiatoa alba]|nr:DUF1538 domain-containing protein [Beggiatoa alba]
MSAATVQQKIVSYNQITHKPEYDPEGHELHYTPPKIHLRWLDVYRLLQPYIQVRLFDQLRAILPIAFYLYLFQEYILLANINELQVILFGLFAVVIGLMLFMEGLKYGLMPFGENIGDVLPRKLGLNGVLFIVFLLGIGVTLAEPAIGALKAAGSIVDPYQATYLYFILNHRSGALVLVVGIGVGLAAVVATLRLIKLWNLKPLIYMTLIPTLLLSFYMHGDSDLRNILGLAWDCGAVTTGPVTVPLVLSLGIGIAAATGRSDNALAGFGIVTLASIFPILGVLLLGVYIKATVPVETILSIVQQGVVTGALPWYETTPFFEIISGIRAIVPLVIFLFCVMVFILKEKIPKQKFVAYGIILAIIGMIVFNLGLTHGLTKLGTQTGGLVPSVFERFSEHWIGATIIFVFAWFLGFGATLAEPALHAVGLTVETLTQGSYKKNLLIYAVSLGVAFGIGCGVLMLIYRVPLAYLLIPGYVVAIILTIMCKEEYVNIAWDSAGVTTGPVTVPLVLALGLGLGNSLHALEGFGILALASIGPILTVLITGLWIEWQVRRSHKTKQQVHLILEDAKRAKPAIKPPILSTNPII